MVNIMKYKYVELFGLPGCGKSYYSNHELTNYINLNKKYIYNDNRLVRNMKKILLIIYLMFFSIKDFINSIIYVKNTKMSYIKKLKMIIYLQTTIAIIKKTSSTKNEECLEEGLHQVLWAICYLDNNNCKQNIVEFEKKFGKYYSSSLIYIKADSSVIEKALKERNDNGGSEIEHDIKNGKEVLDYSEKIIEEIIENSVNINIKVIER